MRRAGFRFALGLTLLLTLPLFAQRRHDPLNPLEIDQLRDAMLDPDERLKLYVKFARERMNTLEQMRADPKTTDRPRQTHDMLQDFLAVYDELNDNIDMYVGRKNDIRRPLKLIIEADTNSRPNCAPSRTRPIPMPPKPGSTNSCSPTPSTPWTPAPTTTARLSPMSRST